MRKSIIQRMAIGIAFVMMLQIMADYMNPARTAAAEDPPLQKQIVWAEDFESYEAGTQPTDVVIDNPSGTDLQVTDAVYAGEGNKSLIIADNTASARVSLTKSFAAKENLILELDIYADGSTENYNWLEIHLRNGSSSGSRFYLKHSGILEYYESGKFSRVEGDTRYDFHTWNRFRFELNNTTHTYDVYMNDVLVDEGIPMESAINDVDNLFIMTNSSGTNYTNYLDNVELYTLGEDSGQVPPDPEDDFNFIWEEDFESGEVGQRPEGFQYSTSNGSSVTISDPETDGTGTKAMKIVEANDGTSSNITKELPPLSDAVLEMDVFVDDPEAQWLDIRLRQDTGHGGPYFTFKHSGILEYYNSGFKQFDNNPKYSIGEWNRLRVETDTAAGLYQVYLNGEQIGFNVPMNLPENASPIEQIDRLYLATNTRVMNTIYLDNIKVSGMLVDEEPPPSDFDLIWEEDFESGEIGQRPGGFTYSIASGSSVTISDPENDVTDTKAMKIVDGNAGTSSNITKELPPLSDAILEMDVYLDDETDQWLDILLRDGTASGPYLNLRANGLMRYRNPDTGSFTNINPRYVVNEWNRLRIETDTAAGQYHVYVNDEQAGHIPMYAQIEQVDRLYIATNNAVLNTVYLDNIKVSGIPIVEEPLPFGLSIPDENATMVEVPTVFQWHPHEDASSYVLTIAEDEDFSTVVYEEIVGLVTEAVVATLDFETSYYWKVTAVTPDGDIPSPEVHRFTTDSERSLLLMEDFENYALGTEPPFATISAPKGSTVLVSEEQSSGEGNRSLEIADGHESTATRVEWPFNSVKDAVLELDIYVDNWLEVHLRNGSDSGPRITFKNSGILEYYRTADGRFTRLPFTYPMNEWMRVRIETNTENYTYRLFINGSQIGEDLPMDHEVNAIDKLYISTNTRLNGHQAYLDNIRVEGYRKDGAPRDFSLLSPADETVEVESPVTLSWEPSSLAEQYRIILSTNQDLSNPVVDELLSAESTSLSVNDLLYNAEYYWKVIAINGVAETDSRETFSFQTESTLYPLDLQLLSVTDIDGQTIDDLAAARFVRLEGTVFNQTDGQIDGIVAAALYNADEELTDIVFVETSFSARNGESIQAGLSLPVNPQYHFIKLFVWDQLDTQNYLSNQVIFGSTGN